ncbi:amidase [Metabacillus iocasae]|uniref:Amidase n=1 Tax=Priestia iocasae TaxID=2291674 RepID=A0ABS2QWE5_9BACI|nr:amidase [Metabacillus iocasae]MBM7703518.1 hypothetical protein [Metabacillus iocasae]
MSKKRDEVATWIWDTTLIQSEMNDLLTFINDEKISTIYLQYSNEVKAEDYQQFISAMTDQDVIVYALDGSPTWGNDRTEENEFFTWLSSYQRAALPNERFQGVHIDVEPYLQDKWDVHQDEMIKQYQQVVQRVAARSAEMDLRFGVDMPFWFDELIYENQFGQGILAKWILSTVDEATIMAYRNHAEGEGGIIELSENEVKWANERNKRIIIAVETVPLEESYTSFYSKEKEVLYQELRKVKQFYKQESSFSGIAVHHLSSWKEWKEQ